MSLSLVFTICNTLVLPQWLLMIVAPRWQWTQKLIRSTIIPIALALVYGFFIFSIREAEGGFGSLEEVKKLFSYDVLILAGWLHYLVFDLLVGTWVLTNGQEKGIPHWQLVPCVLGCFLMGPLGFLLYRIISYFK